MFTIENVLDNIKLRHDRGRLRCCAVTLQSSNDFFRFVVLALADQETRRIWQERAEDVDDQSEDDLECERESPCDATGEERKS